MQLGNRPLASQSPRPFRARAESAQSTVNPASPEADKSAARLAAEEAFSAPAFRLPQAVLPPLVTVRRARVAFSTSSVLHRNAPGQEMLGNETDERTPRVFRVESRPDPLPDESNKPAEGGLASTSAKNDARDVIPGPRKKRIAADRRPGPVMTVFEVPVSHRPDDKAAMDVRAPAIDRRLESLVERMASLDPIFESIRRAQAFRVSDERFAHEWLRLSRAADKLQSQIEQQVEGFERRS